MHASLLTYFRNTGIQGDALQTVLPILIREKQDSFCRFVDCGAGIGHKAKQLISMLKTGLKSNEQEQAILYAYEPLPENIVGLRRNLEGETMVQLRPVAVSDFNGTDEFTVPWRCSDKESAWSPGTSYVGFLGARKNQESIPVQVVRLDSETIPRLDFIKLDLQGGERRALQGLGQQIAAVQAVYAEHQFLRNPDSQPLNYLTEQNFISFFDRVQIGFKKELAHLPLPVLEEAGVVVERAVVEKEARMGLTLYGHIDSNRVKHLQLDGNYTTAFADKLIDSGVAYFQTDLLAINRDIYGAWLRMISNSIRPV